MKSHATETVEAPAAKAHFTEEHFEAVRGGVKSNNRKGGGFNLGKKVEASGEKLTGYGVQILQGGKVVADYFSEPSLKEKIEGGEKK